MHRPTRICPFLSPRWRRFLRGVAFSLCFQLREELNAATAELESTKEAMNGAQATLSVTQAEARELRRQAKLQLPRLQSLRREHELLCEALQRPHDEMWNLRAPSACASAPTADERLLAEPDHALRPRRAADTLADAGALLGGSYAATANGIGEAGGGLPGALTRLLGTRGPESAVEASSLGAAVLGARDGAMGIEGASGLLTGLSGIATAGCEGGAFAEVNGDAAVRFAAAGALLP